MNYYFVTGSSKGLGKSLVELLLKDESSLVYGLSRTSSIKHDRYFHTDIDLSDLEQVKSFVFPEISGAEKITLINNAGIVGDIKHVGSIDNQKIIECYNLNLIAPVILSNNFISKYASLISDKMILNISSGAGRSPIDGWNVYCSSKSGLDMFSQVFDNEIKLNSMNTRVLSLAPGIIDTEMQAQIRGADLSNFSSIKKFKKYKQEGGLSNSKNTAKQVLRFIEEKELSKNVICSVRDLTE